MACEPAVASVRADGVRLAVRLTPRGGRDAVTGRIEAADGTALITAVVRAPPEGGKANAALLALLARVWRLPKSAVSLVAGGSGRRKIVHVAGDPAVLCPAIEAWLESPRDGRLER